MEVEEEEVEEDEQEYDEGRRRRMWNRGRMGKREGDTKVERIGGIE